MSHAKEHHRDKKHKHTHAEKLQELNKHRHKVPGYIQRQQQQAEDMEKLRAQNTTGTLQSVNSNGNATENSNASRHSSGRKK